MSTATMPTGPAGRTVAEIAAITGISEMNLRRLALPSIRSGRGRTAILPDREAFAAFAAVRLKRAGLTYAAVARGIAAISAVDFRVRLARGERWLVVGPDSASIVDRDAIMRSTGANPGTILDLAPVYERYLNAVALLLEGRGE